VRLLKAVVKSRPEPGVEVRDVPVPEPAGDEVLIRVKAAAICGSDLGIYRYTAAYSGMRLPVVMGHEFAGEVSETGSLVEGYAAGDRVISESVKACGRCGFCRQGMSNLCEDSTLFGIHTDGGFAEYVAVPQGLLHRMPEGMSYEEAALVEPLGNAVHFVDDVTPYKPGDLVVVQGCGPIGLFSAQLFRLGGARVIVSGLGVDGVRLGIAERLGFEAVNIDAVDLVGHVMDLTGGTGADVAFVAAGAPPAVKQAMELVRKRGTITVVGIFGGEVPVDLTQLVRREIKVVGAYDARPANFPTSISHISEGKVNVRDVLTHRFSLEDAEEAFSVALDRTGGKVEFTP
jgi:L-iditol 2-dehydrogenase